MINLIEINENNWKQVVRLKVTDNQKQFVAPAPIILARAYVFRNQNARALAISDDDTIVGVLLVRDLDEEPSCYDLQQILIDKKHQNQGYGQKALNLIIDELKQELKYSSIEVCVKKSDTVAIHIYKKTGFADSGYQDPNEPDSYIMVYKF